MKSKLLLSALSLFGLNSIAQVVPNIDWVRYYSERAQISNVPSAIDANSNVYITGYTYPTPSNADLTTVKYDALGNVVWVQHYNNGGYDDANAITLDASSNVYVAGESDGTGTGRDLVVVKYDVNGNQLWASRYNGTANLNDVANAIVVDGSGNVFVTGRTTVAGNTTNYVTIKFDASGVQQWVHLYNGTGNNNDESVGIDLSSNGRLYVTGSSKNASGNSDIVTIRINQNNGNQMWVKSINGSSNNNDKAYSLLADGNDVVVVGSQNNTITGDDYITFKYNGNNGNTIWQRTYDNNNGSQTATSIVKDASNNYVVTGTSFNASVVEYHTIMYNNAGALQWTNINNINQSYSSVTPKLAVDPIANHFYVCGEKTKNNSDILVYQITPSGNKSWEETFNGAQNGPDAAVDLVVNTSGILYIAGASLNSNAKFDYTTIRISQTPVYFPPDITGNANDKSFLFYENLGQEVDINYNPINDIKYVTNSAPKYYFKETGVSMVFGGLTNDSNNVDTIHRIDLNFFEANKLTKIYSFEEYGGNINYILGHYNSSNATIKGKQRLMIPNLYSGIDLHYYSNKDGGLKYYFVVKPGTSPNIIRQVFNSINYTTNLNLSGQIEVNSSVGKISLDKPIAYQVNLTGQPVTLSGNATWITNALNDYSIKIPNYNPSLPLIIMVNQVSKQSAISTINLGNLKWSTFIGGGDDDQSWAVTVDKSGYQHIAGATSSLNFPTFGFQVIASGALFTTNRLGFYAKFNSLHQQIVTTYIGGNDQTDAFDVKTNSLGDAYIVGTTQATNFPYKKELNAFNDTAQGSTASGASQDCFIVKFNSLNQYVWGTYFGGTNNDHGRACTIDKQDNLYLVGSARSVAIPLVPNGSAHQQSWAGAYDGFIAKFDSQDNIRWFTYYGGSHLDYAYSCVTDSNSNVYISGATYSNNFPTYRINNGYYKDSTLNGTYDVFALKFNSAGVRQWATYFGGTGDEGSLYGPTHKGISIDKSQNIYINDNTTSTDLSTKRINSTCYYDSTFGGNIDGFLLRFNPNLNFQYCTYIGNTNYDYVHSAEFDSNSNLYISFGTGNSNINTQPLGGYYYQNAMNGMPLASYGADNFLLSLNSNLSPRWASYLGGTSYNALGDEGTSIAINGTDMYLTGYCNSYNANATDVRFPIFYPGSPAYIDSTYNDATQSNKSDGFISKFDLAALVGIEEYFKDDNKSSIQLFPNPTSNNLNIKFNSERQEKVKFRIYSSDGKLVYETLYPIIEGMNLIQINTNYLSTGIYFIQLQNQDYSVSEKFIKYE